MSPPVIAFFNNKGDVDKTSLVYHLAWMYRMLGLTVLAADLDPQANLTVASLDEDAVEDVWLNVESSGTVFSCIRPLLEGTGDVGPPVIQTLSDNLGLIAGDLMLSSFEDELSQQWPQCMDGKSRAFRVITAFWRVLHQGARDCNASVILVDVGPNLGAINRAALVAADHLVVPLSPDLFSLRGLENLGPTLRRWREEWRARSRANPDPARFALPPGAMRPAGYVILQHSVRLDRPVKAYGRWMDRIPLVYREAVLDETTDELPTVDEDPHCLGRLKHYRSLMPMAQEAHKPMFLLRSADGAIGAHQAAVRAAWSDFEHLARSIAAATGLSLPASPV